MNRDDFIDLLARLVADGELTEDEAATLLAQFDAGVLPATWQLPLPVADAIKQHDSKAEEAALLLLLLLLARRGRNELTRLPQRSAISVANSVQAQFEQDVEELARQFSAGRLTLPAWQTQMLDQIDQHVTAQMFLANGRNQLTQPQTQRLNQIMATQGAFLLRFADQLALRAGTGNPATMEYIANRAAQYGGVGREEFFRSSEESADQGHGWVYDYLSRDDKFTCSNCLDAQYAGPYLQGQGPYPGQVCKGRGYCRCRRVARYDPVVYERLGGR